MEEIVKRVSELESTMSTLLKNIQEVNNSIAVGFRKVEGNFLVVNDKIDALRGNTTSSIETVEHKLSDLTSEISKINEVTNYEGIFNNTLKLVQNN